MQELVDHMMCDGLRFAAAVEGNEAAYVAVHRALATWGQAPHTQLGDLEEPEPEPAPAEQGPIRGLNPVPQAGLPSGPFPQAAARLPPYTFELFGRNVVQIVNRSNRAVAVGFRVGDGGKDVLVPAQGVVPSRCPTPGTTCITSPPTNRRLSISGTVA